MEQSIQSAPSGKHTAILTYSYLVTALHAAAILSWVYISQSYPEMEHADKIDIYNRFWFFPEFMGRWFSFVLLLLSISVVVIAGRMADQGKEKSAIILVLLNLCFVLLSGWSLL